VSPRLTLAANADVAREAQAPVTSPDAGAPARIVDGSWKGLAGYATVTVTPRFTLGFRGEWFNDPEGVRTAVGQTLTEWTITPTLRVPGGFVVRLDLRQDVSDQSVFQTRDGYGTTQTTVLINGLYSF
jgi:hypothetical protein